MKVEGALRLLRLHPLGFHRRNGRRTLEKPDERRHGLVPFRPDRSSGNEPGVILQRVGQPDEFRTSLADDLADLRHAESTAPRSEGYFGNIATGGQLDLRLQLFGKAELLDDAR